MRIALAMALLGCVAACGPKQAVTPTAGPPYPDNACAYGQTGVDTDQDGINDLCETGLGTPGNDPDCDRDGIPDSRDDPTQCYAPGATPPAGSEEYRAANADRIYQELGDGFILGSTALTSTAIPGTSVELLIQRLQIFTTVPAGATVPCTPPYLYLHTAGRVSYCDPNWTGPCDNTDGTATQVEFCANLSGLDAALTQARTSSPGDLPEVTIQNIEWSFARTERGVYDLDVLKYDGAETATTSLGITLKEATVKSVSCANRVLFRKLEAKWTSAFLQNFHGTLYAHEDEATVIDGGVQTFVKNWMRIGDESAQVCNAPGALGLWANAAPSS